MWWFCLFTRRLELLRTFGVLGHIRSYKSIVHFQWKWIHILHKHIFGVCSYSDALAACNYLPQSREKIIAALFKALNSTNSELQEAGEACMRKVSSLTKLVFFYSPFSAFLPAALPLMSSAWNNRYRMEWGRRWGKWMWLWCIILLWKTGLGFIRVAFPLLMEIHWALSFSVLLLTGDWKSLLFLCSMILL